MNIIIAGGGTGGHLFPGIAIAREFQKRSRSNRILFLGSAQGIEARILPQLGYRLQTITVKGFKGKGLRKQMQALMAIPAGIYQAGNIIRRFSADIIIGVGGYISFPPLAAGILLRIPTAIHEQNSVPGLSNRSIGKLVDRIFITYEASRAFFKPARTVLSGMPLRCPDVPVQPTARTDQFCIFVCGGSQGAREINQAVIAGLPHLEDLKTRIRFIHQCGTRDLDFVRSGYQQAGFSAETAPFIDDMMSCYQQAHLVICRAGAATLAELAACGRAALLIPYPYATDNHQEKNARVLTDSGAALLQLSARLNAETLAARIRELEQNRAEITILEERIKTFTRPQAAETIANECCHLVNKHKGD
ncbi:MAG: undecaprenyldiphospho-muramoylpentapeptide beta-N-acetylglucosaminyltransferase [Deltaproteobacteria bacterium]|nr:undecaprenyldiphospho-muramoylpentapeptide beta-N-acetylglucosaminyltransferase [Deltaproteobacteria bacterium]